MKKKQLLIMLIAIFFTAGVVSAEMYQWTDENGVKSYSNSPPPEGVQAESSWSEIAYDEEADLARMAELDQALEEWSKLMAEEEALQKEMDAAEAQKQTAEEINALEAKRVQLVDQLAGKRRYIQTRARRHAKRLNNIDREIVQLQKTAGNQDKIEALEQERTLVIEQLKKNKRYFHRGGQQMVNEVIEIDQTLEKYGR